ncbi:MAG: putative membrane-bound redox modulator Alx [Phycisphaerae bacterium]|nr:putative membrane-bound redox modulator Alx [Phycisphaerae bacterium]
MFWWVTFNLFVLAMLALDLGVFHRKSHEVRFREALTWSGVWIALALLFNLGIYAGWFGDYPAADRGRVAIEFLTGYLIEKSLSVDNVFVFAMIFSYFAVPAAYQHKVLFYGILGALLCRAAFIFGGLWLIEHFAWTIYLFGALLIITGIKMVWAKGKQIDPEKNPIMRLSRALLPVRSQFDGDRFITRDAGRWAATPLLLVLIFVETTDVIFAVDSIPAIIAITTDPFIVYTSNVFAILGLRALYFALASFMKMFHYLTYGLAVLLIFIGGKMLAHAGLGYKMPVGASLGIIALILTVAIAASLLAAPRTPRPATAT